MKKTILIILAYILISAFVSSFVKALLGVEITGSFFARITFITLENASGAILLLLMMKLRLFPTDWLEQ